MFGERVSERDHLLYGVQRALARCDLSEKLRVGGVRECRVAKVERVLQNIVDALTGNIAKLLATLAVIITGMAWMFGYLDLRRAGFVIMGVAILFGASEIVGTLTGK